MKVTPQITADFEEYPELNKLLQAAVQRVVDLMEIHDIVELRRVRKSGVFDHPYHKDIVTPMGMPYVPSSVSAARYTVGSALLDYLEAIGMRGLALDVSKEDAEAISAIWAPPKQEQPPAPKPDEPKPGDDPLKPTPVPEQQPASSDKTENDKKNTTTKPAKKGGQKESEKQKNGKAQN